MRLLWIAVVLLGACSPLKPDEKLENEVDTDWPSVLEAKASDPAVLLEAEAEVAVTPPRRDASDIWIGDDRSLRTALAPLIAKLEEDGALAGWGTGGGSATLDLALTEQGFDDVAQKQGWEIPPYVGLTFVAPLVVQEKTPEAGKWVKVMPIEPVRTVFQLSAMESGRIFLDHGCLYVGEPDGIRRLAFFHAETGIDVRDGELVLVNRITGLMTGRIGEKFSWGAPNHFKEDWPAAKALRAACGTGDVVNVGNPEATTLFDARAAEGVTGPADPSPPGMKDAANS